MNKLILGTAQFGMDYGINNNQGKISINDVNQILDIACKNEIEMLDTAAVYGNSEKVIGAYHNSNCKFKVITKLASNTIADWEKILNESLKSLDVEKVDTLLFHSFESYKSLRSTKLYSNLLSYKGKYFSNLGVSVYTNNELNLLKEDDTINLIQSPFNVLDNELKRRTIFLELKNAGKKIYTRSVFLQGLFFMNEQSIPKSLNAILPFINRLKNIALSKKKHIGELALQYALSKDYIDGVLIGVDSVEQLKLNLEWASNIPSTKFFEEIDRINVDNDNLLNPSLWHLQK